ncbi:hypothetical protein [Fimbriiglobus ruber]|uniref:hypothetical protein n=1 Tax=Fimbriiglobus ruber TaxID=1908690 RepID=UPI000B4BEDD4|nr:hypothetical protein [Fimbriiglobus ruber]
MVLVCPYCESKLLARHGVASELDGERSYICLTCQAQLQPRRYRPLFYFFFFLAVIFPLPLAAIGVWVLAQAWEAIRWAVLLFGCAAALLFGCAATCVFAAVQIRRVLWLPVPNKFPTTSYPDPRVRLTELKERTKVWALKNSDGGEPLTDYVSAVIDSAGRCLGRSRTAYKAVAKIRVNYRFREVTVGYRGKVDSDSLQQFFDEINTKPLFKTARGDIALELWFKVRP